MLPASRIFRPVLERFFKMKLNRVDQLSARVLDHHLVPASIGGSQKFEPVWNAVHLHAMILPNSKYVIFFCIVLPYTVHFIVDPRKNRVRPVYDLYEPILILNDAIRSLGSELEIIERLEIRAKGHPDQLMRTTDRENRYRGRSD